MIVGYARVSSIEQDTALQVAALRASAIDRLFEDTMTGVGHRSALERALYCLRRGDLLVVYKVDRLARSLADLLRILDRVRLVGASFRSLTEPIDTTTPVGVLMLQLLGSFAEFERSMIRERCSAGRVAARARGVRFGRPPKVDLSSLPALVSSGLASSEIARIYDCDPSSVRHAVKRLGLAS